MSIHDRTSNNDHGSSYGIGGKAVTRREYYEDKSSTLLLRDLLGNTTNIARATIIEILGERIDSEHLSTDNNRDR